MDRLATIGEASKVLGVSITTLRRWEKEDRLQPDEIIIGDTIWLNYALNYSDSSEATEKP